MASPSVPRPNAVTPHSSCTSAHTSQTNLGADHEIGLNLQLTFGRTGPHPTNAAVLLQQARHLRLHAQLECAMALALTGKKIEEISLRHEGNEAAARRQTCEVGNTEPHRAKLSAKVVRLVVQIVRKSGTPCGAAARNSSSTPNSCINSSVDGWIVSPRKSRRKSPCFSSTMVRTPARESSTPNIMPAGPPPTMQQVVSRADTLRASPGCLLRRLSHVASFACLPRDRGNNIHTPPTPETNRPCKRGSSI